MPSISGTKSLPNASPQQGEGSATQASSGLPGGHEGKSSFGALIDSLSQLLQACGCLAVTQKDAQFGSGPSPHELLKDTKTEGRNSGATGANPQNMSGTPVALPNLIGTIPPELLKDTKTEGRNLGATGGNPQNMSGTPAALPNPIGTIPEGTKTDAAQITNAAKEPIIPTAASHDKESLQQLIDGFGKSESGNTGKGVHASLQNTTNITETAGAQNSQGTEKKEVNETRDSKSLPEFDSLLSLKSTSGKGQSLQLEASATQNSRNANETNTTTHDNEGRSSHSSEPLNSENMGFAAVVRQENAAVPHGQSGPSEPPTVKPNVTDMTDSKVYIMKDSSNLAVTLEPDGLGKLNIQLSLDKGMISTQISVPDNAVKNLIENNIQHMIHSLMNEGLSVGGFSVSLRDGQGTGQSESQYLVSRRGNEQTMRNTPEMTSRVDDRNSDDVNSLVNMYI